MSRKTVLCGSQNIVLNGKVIVQTGAIIRGDLSNVRTGRYCVISQNAVIRPAYKQFSTGCVQFLFECYANNINLIECLVLQNCILSISYR